MMSTVTFKKINVLTFEANNPNLVTPLRNEPSKLLGAGLDGPLLLGIALVITHC